MRATRPSPGAAAAAAQVAWRRQPLARLAPGFQRQVFLARHRNPQCALCALIMDQKKGDRSALAEHRAAWPRATRAVPAVDGSVDASAGRAQS